MTKRNLLVAAASAGLFGVAAVSHAAPLVQITEFCSNTGSSQLGEYVEITNMDSVPVDMTGWSEDDSTRTANKSGHSLSGFGTLQPGESAIFTEATPAAFRTEWFGSPTGRPASLKIVGPYTNDNLSSSGDEVNLYDNNGVNVDRLIYGGANGGPGSGVSRNAPNGYVVNSNLNVNWVNSSIGDAYNSFQAAGISDVTLIGNPGVFTFSTPEPASLTLLAIGGLALGRRRCAKMA